MDRAGVRRLAELWGVVIKRENSHEILMECPYAPLGIGHKHLTDQNPNFSVTVSDDRSVCICFACSAKGSLLAVAHDLAQRSGSPDFKQAYQLVKKAESGMFLPKAVEAKEAYDLSEDESLQRVMAIKQPISSVLRARGITDIDIEKWNLGYDPSNNRDIFPIYDINSKLVAITGRRTNEEDFPKYCHYGSSPKNITQVFYGEQFLDMTINSGILVEGPLDTIRASRVFPNVLGQCGAEVMTPARMKRLGQWFNSVTLMFDGDAPGKTGMFAVGLCLFKRFSLFVAFLPDGLDPFEASTAELQDAMEKRVLWSLVDWGTKGVETQSHKYSSKKNKLSL